jgi:CxC2 like cysteine cluster associated with KDZ transposases
MHLGHQGDPCPIPGDVVENFTVVAMNGVHSIDVQFCGCYGTAGGSHSRVQLLRAGLLPPTHTRPISAFTFDVLDSFHLLTLQGKTSAYDYYLSLAHKTDNTGLLDTKVCASSTSFFIFP